MNTKRTTQIGLLALVTAIIGYDIFVAVEPTDDDTISEVIKFASKEFPLIPFAWGILTAHLFSRRKWDTYEFKDMGNARYITLGAVAAGVLGASFLPQLGGVSQWVFMAAGGLAGFLLWPQFRE